MRRSPSILLFVLLLSLASCADSGVYGPKRNPLVADLLSKIDSSNVFIARKEAKLAELRADAEATVPGSMENYNALLRVGSEYSKFEADSALAFYDRAIKCAQTIGDKSLETRALFRKVGVLSVTGLFVEALEILESVDKSKLDEDLITSYYSAYKGLYHSVYQGLSSKPELRQIYVRKYESYRDSVMFLDSESSYQYMREEEKIYARSGRYEEAIAINDKRLEMYPRAFDQARASVLYDRYVIYHFYMGRPIEDHIECLLQSAIIDVVCANQDIASLRYVESYLSSLGDLDGAKKISDYYYATMMKFGSRFRLLIGMDLTIKINDDYAVLLARQKKRIQISLSVIVVLSLILLAILWMELISRRKIVELNKKLKLSDKTAKGYVLGFFQLYSSYISRLQALRSKINTNTRKGNAKYVLDLTDPSKDFTNEELKQMYNNFDSAFLDIYPNFVQDFNALLKPECRITLKPNELLNTDLRIFAIIKLGITDSARISELLHCSIKTVYNKRSGINTKLLVPKDDFAKKLAEI